MSLRNELETKLTTPLLGVRPIDELVRMSRQLSDALFKVEDLYGWFGADARQMRILGRMNLLDPQWLLELATASAGIVQALANIRSGESIWSERALAMNRRLTGWLESAGHLRWDGAEMGTLSEPDKTLLIDTLLTERGLMVDCIKNALHGPSDEGGDDFERAVEEASKAAKDLDDLVRAVVETL